MHSEKCVDCHTTPPAGFNRFLVKDSETRESIHVLAATSQKAAAKTGWLNPLFILMVEMGPPLGNDEKLATKERNGARLLAIRQEKEESFEELKNERSAIRATKRSSRSVGEQKEAAMKDPNHGIPANLPPRFYKQYKGRSYEIQHFADGTWSVNGKKLATAYDVREAILGRVAAKNYSNGGSFFRRIATTTAEKKPTGKKASAKKAAKPKAKQRGNKKKRPPIPQRPPIDGVGASDKAA